MSVTTTADEKLVSAKDHVKEAIDDLMEIVVRSCWGYDEFKRDYFEQMRDALKLLIDANNLLRY